MAETPEYKAARPSVWTIFMPTEMGPAEARGGGGGGSGRDGACGTWRLWKAKAGRRLWIGCGLGA